MAGAGPKPGRRNFRYLKWVQGPKYRDHLSLLFQEHYQGAQLEVEQLQLNLAWQGVALPTTPQQWSQSKVFSSNQTNARPSLPEDSNTDWFLNYSESLRVRFFHKFLQCKACTHLTCGASGLCTACTQSSPAGTYSLATQCQAMH